MVNTHIGNHRKVWLDDIDDIEAAAQPHFQYPDITVVLGKNQKSGKRRHFKK